MCRNGRSLVIIGLPYSINILIFYNRARALQIHCLELLRRARSELFQTERRHHFWVRLTGRGRLGNHDFALFLRPWYKYN